VSQINEAVNAGLSVSARITFSPYNLLKAVGRDTELCVNLGDGI